MLKLQIRGSRLLVQKLVMMDAAFLANVLLIGYFHHPIVIGEEAFCLVTVIQYVRIDAGCDQMS